MCCSNCLAIPTITLKLLATAFALLYGQRQLTKNSHKWTRRVTFTVTALISLVISAISIFLIVLHFNDDFRRRFFVNFCAISNLKPTPLDEHRCSILQEGNVTGKIIEFGPGPGTNFKCFENSTTAHMIEHYVAVEPNPHFEGVLKKEKVDRGLEFPLTHVGLKGELIDISDNGSYDVVIMTHVLCSVDSPEIVLSNAEKALKPGGRIIFMEHVLAGQGTWVWYFQQSIAPMFTIIANGCKFVDLRPVMEDFLSDRFELKMLDFEAPMPASFFFARPHIKGVAVKK